MLKRSLAFIILLLFVGYWMLTLLYLSPSNPIRISSKDTLALFRRVNGQRWNFFAPPPTYNQRLYYTFTSKSTGQSVSFEVIKPIVAEKQRKAPFNDGEHVFDYVLFTSVQRIIKIIHIKAAHERLVAARKHFTPKPLPVTILTTADLQMPAGRSLVNYAAFVAKKQNIDLADSKVSFYVTMAKLPPFMERAKLLSNVTLEERLAFKSVQFEIPANARTNL